MAQKRLLASPVGLIIQEPNDLVRDCLQTMVNKIDDITVFASVASLHEAIPIALKLRPEIMLVNLAGANGERSHLTQVREEVPGLRMIWLEDLPAYDLLRANLANGNAELATGEGLTKDLARDLESARRATSTIASEFANPILVHYADIIKQRHDRDTAIIETLAAAIDAKETTTGAHAQRVSVVATQLARQVDPTLEGNQPMRYGFVLHDIGKVGIPDRILLKEGALEPEEWATVKTHPTLGQGLVAPLRLGDEAESVIKHHHERWDGHGYPDGLAGNDIPLGARIFSVADTFDAITNDRPYRRAMTRSAAVVEVRKGAGKEFDPQVVESFLEMASRQKFD